MHHIMYPYSHFYLNTSLMCTALLIQQILAGSKSILKYQSKIKYLNSPYYTSRELQIALFSLIETSSWENKSHLKS